MSMDPRLRFVLTAMCGSDSAGGFRRFLEFFDSIIGGVVRRIWRGGNAAWAAARRFRLAARAGGCEKRHPFLS